MVKSLGKPRQIDVVTEEGQTESESGEAVKTRQVLIAKTRRSPDGDYDVLNDVVTVDFLKAYKDI